MNCKRCGRVLRSEKSIALGYGETCYRIASLQKPVVDIESEISFLKREISMLKSIIKSNNITRSRPIERIKITQKDLVQPAAQLKMSDVINEMKNLFNSRDWRASVLRSINPSTEPVAPPNLYV